MKKDDVSTLEIIPPPAVSHTNAPFFQGSDPPRGRMCQNVTAPSRFRVKIPAAKANESAVGMYNRSRSTTDGPIH
jgi:hypothetical protein